MKTVGVILARTGSSRLPGKMMYPLCGEPAVSWVINRTTQSESLDGVALATSDTVRDDVLANVAQELGVQVYRGAEDDVLGRTYSAAKKLGADQIVRIAGDCIFVSPSIVDQTVDALARSDADYASNKLERTFPLGLDVEAFTAESFKIVNSNARTEPEREHVTLYYLNRQTQFECVNIKSDDVFSSEKYVDRTDVEMVLDEAADYMFFREVVSNGVDMNTDIREIIDIIDEQELNQLNASVDR